METVKNTVQSAAGKVVASVSGKTAVHFGSGNIGRGFVAEFLHKSGYEVVFVDVIDKLIDQLKETKSYKVNEIGTDDEQTFTITNYRALHSIKENEQVVEEIAKADVVTCAVGPSILNRIAPTIAKGIDARKADYPVAIIACENAIGGTDTLMGHVKKDLKTPESEWPDRFRAANCAIDRIVPGQDPNAGLDVKIEKFYEWCVEEKVFQGAKNGKPNITGVHYVENLTPYIERKLYTVNTGHATAAYYGHSKGKKVIYEAMADDEIKTKVRDTLRETAHLIVSKHGIKAEEQEKYVETIVKRISNTHLHDGVDRVGRAPLRKLSRKERFIGPAAELAERGDSVDNLLGGIEMAFRFTNVSEDEESVKLKQMLDELSAEEAVSKICGLEKSDKLYFRVVDVVKKVQGK